MTNPNEPKGSTDDINTNLYEACLRGKTEIVKSLLENGADVNTKFQHNNTALYAAVIANEAEIVELLLQYGADVNTKCNNDGQTILFAAVNCRSHETTKLLLERGADPNVQCIGDQRVISTALHIASQHTDCKSVELLLKYGASPNAPYKRSTNGQEEIIGTILHSVLTGLATEYYNDDCRNTIKLLLQHGADIDCFIKLDDNCIINGIDLKEIYTAAKIADDICNLTFVESDVKLNGTWLDLCVSRIDYYLKHDGIQHKYSKFCSFIEENKQQFTNNPLLIKITELLDEMSEELMVHEAALMCKLEVTDTAMHLYDLLDITFSKKDADADNIDKLLSVYAKAYPGCKVQIESYQKDSTNEEKIVQLRESLKHNAGVYLESVNSNTLAISCFNNPELKKQLEFLESCKLPKELEAKIADVNKNYAVLVEYAMLIRIKQTEEISLEPFESDHGQQVLGDQSHNDTLGDTLGDF